MLAILHHVEIIETINQIIQDERTCQLLVVRQQWLENTRGEQEYKEASRQLLTDIRSLKKLTPENRKTIEGLADTTEKLIDLLNQLQSTINRPGSMSERNFPKEISSLEELFLRTTTALRPELTICGFKIDDRLTQNSRMIKFIVVSSLTLNMVVSLLLAIAFNMSTTRRLLSLAENSERLAKGASLLPPIGGNDEISTVDRAFRNMAVALEKAESRERAMINNAIDVICSLNSDMQFVSISPSCRTILGREPQELQKQPITAICLTEDAQSVVTKLKSARSESNTLEFRIVKPDGSVCEILASILWSATQQEYFMVMHDMSVRKSLERLKQHIVALISHELRTPLTSIRAFLAILSSNAFGELNEEGLINVSRIDTEALRLIGLINDLLDMERLEASQLALLRSSTSTDLVLARAVNAVLPIADQAEVIIETQVESFSIFADEDRLVQVLINLLSNAIKYSPRKTKIVVNVAEEPEQLVFTVSDQGCGIPPQYRLSIFEKFQQIESAEYHRKGSTGLGLAICKAIVEQHGGKIEVESKSDNGSVFRFTIPHTHAHR